MEKRKMDVECGRLAHRHPHHGRPPCAHLARDSPAVPLRQHPHPSFSRHHGRSCFDRRTAQECYTFLSLDDKCLVTAYVLVILLCCLFFALVGVAIYATALFLSLPDNADNPSATPDGSFSSPFDPSLRLPRIGGKGFFVVGAPPHSSLFIDDSDGSVHIFHGISYVLRKWSTSTDLATSRSRGGSSSSSVSNRDSTKRRQAPATQDEEIERHMEAIAGLGLNLVRLGVQWADYEPTRGHYDPSYVRLVRHAVDAAARHGLRVLIYSHQVMLSAKLCGEGFPDWAVLPSVSGDNVRSMGKTFDDFLDRIDRLRSGLYDDDDGDGDEAEAWGWIHEADDQGQEHPQPEQADIGMELPDDCPAWLAPSYYFTPQVASAYQNFYLGQQGTMHRFGAWWADVARRFTDDPAVIGYQLLSQPFAGNYYHSPALLHPGENDARNLAAVYAFLSMQIRRVDADHLIFFSDTYAVPLSRSMSPTSSLSLPASTPSAGAAYSSTASRDSLVTHAGVGFTRLPSATLGGGRRQLEWWTEGDSDGECERDGDGECERDDGGDAGRKWAGKEVLAFSYECWYFDQTDPFPVPAYHETCNLFKGEDLLGYRKRDARRLGSGLLVHGLGGCGSSREERSCEYLLEEANAGSLSWSYGLDHDHDEVRRVLDAAGGGETQLRRLLSRPFARKLAGVPRSATFDPKTRHFTLAFYPFAQEQGGKRPGGVTEIYLDEALHYPKGYTVSVFPMLLEHAAVPPEKNLLRLSLRAEFGQGRFEPGEVVVTIAPKQ